MRSPRAVLAGLAAVLLVFLVQRCQLHVFSLVERLPVGANATKVRRLVWSLDRGSDAACLETPRQVTIELDQADSSQTDLFVGVSCADSSNRSPIELIWNNERLDLESCGRDWCAQSLPSVSRRNTLHIQTPNCPCLQLRVIRLWQWTEKSDEVARNVDGTAATNQLGPRPSPENPFRAPVDSSNSTFLASDPSRRRRLSSFYPNGEEVVPVDTENRIFGPNTLECIITTVDTMYPTAAEDAIRQLEDDFACIPEHNRDLLLLIELPDWLIAAHAPAIETGMLRVAIQGAKAGNFHVLLQPDAEFTVLEDPHEARRLQMLNVVPQVGVLSLIIVRVSVRNSEPPMSLKKLERVLFEDNISVRNQYAACSFGKLTFEFKNGIDLFVDNRIGTFGSGAALLDSAQRVLLKRRPEVTSLEQVADRVLYCLAPGTPGWIANAGLGHYRININGEWCLSLSAVMHELGHTLGLLHSGKGDLKYGDETGYMGYGERGTGYPCKCFNGVKNWQLGWYQDRQMVVNPYEQPFVRLATFVDYDKTTEEDVVLVNIDYQYYLQYNRAKLFNIDTEFDRDLVTVTRDDLGRSSSIAGLGEEDSWTLENYQSTGRTLVVKVCKRIDGDGETTPDVMMMSIGLDRAYCDKLYPRTSAPQPSMQPAADNGLLCLSKTKRCNASSQCCDGLRCLGRTASSRRCAVCVPRNKSCVATWQCCGSMSCIQGTCSLGNTGSSAGGSPSGITWHAGRGSNR